MRAVEQEIGATRYEFQPSRPHGGVDTVFNALFGKLQAFCRTHRRNNIVDLMSSCETRFQVEITPNRRHDFQLKITSAERLRIAFDLLCRKQALTSALQDRIELRVPANNNRLPSLNDARLFPGDQ